MADQSSPDLPTRPDRAVRAAWPDLFANLQSAYAKVIDTQFELERQAAELEDSRDLLRQVIASMSEALFLLDRTGRVMQVNLSALELVGLDEAHCVGQLFSKICPDPQAPTSAWKILNKSPRGSLIGLETGVRTADGRLHPVSLSASVVRNRSGRIDGVLITLRDIRPLQNLRTQLARENRHEAFRQLAANVGRELALPLEVIRGYLQHLIQTVQPGSPIDQQILDDLHRIDGAADKISRIATRLLDIGRPAHRAYKPININRLVESALLLPATQHLREGIPMERHYEPDLPEVQGDWHELAYVILSILDTAFEQFSRALVALNFCTRLEKRAVCWQITGQIQPDQPDFQPDFQLSEEVSAIVARCGGRIETAVTPEQFRLVLCLPGLVESKPD